MSYILSDLCVVSPLFSFIHLGRRRKGRKEGAGLRRTTSNDTPDNDISLHITNDGPLQAEDTNTIDDVPNEVIPVTKKQTGNRKRRPSDEARFEETNLETEVIRELLTTPTTTRSTTTTTTTTEAPRRHPSTPIHSPIEPQYTVDGGTETTLTIVDIYPEERSEKEDTNTHVEENTHTASEGNREVTPDGLGRRRGRKKKKKTEDYTTPEEELTTEYPDEEVELQDYQNYLYGLENTEGTSSEAVAVEDQFPEGLPEGYPTDRLRSDGNSSQNTR